MALQILLYLVAFSILSLSNVHTMLLVLNCEGSGFFGFFLSFRSILFVQEISAVICSEFFFLPFSLKRTCYLFAPFKETQKHRNQFYSNIPCLFLITAMKVDGFCFGDCLTPEAFTSFWL